MSYDPDIHHRRSTRLEGFNYSRAGAYFVTICTHERVCTLGEIIQDKADPSAAGRIVEEVWRSLPDRFSGVEPTLSLSCPITYTA